MEVHFNAETEKRLSDLALQSGCATPDRLVQDVIEGYFEELADVRELLDSRYDDLKRGCVTPIPGDQIEEWFRERSAAARRLRDQNSVS